MLCCFHCGERNEVDGLITNDLPESEVELAIITARKHQLTTNLEQLPIVYDDRGHGDVFPVREGALQRFVGPQYKMERSGDTPMILSESSVASACAGE